MTVSYLYNKPLVVRAAVKDKVVGSGPAVREKANSSSFGPASPPLNTKSCCDSYFTGNVFVGAGNGKRYTAVVTGNVYSTGNGYAEGGGMTPAYSLTE